MSLADTGAGTPSPRGLSKLRGRNKGLVSTSTNSLPGSFGESDDASSKQLPRDVCENNGGLRASVGNAIDMVTRRRSSVDDRRNSDDVSGRGLLALLSKTKRKVKRGDNNTGDGPDRTLSVDSTNISPGNRSELSLVDGSGGSSLLTDDETVDDARGHPSRPTFSPHQSHAGLLTLSSPEINAQTAPIVPNALLVSSPDAVSTAGPLSNIPAIVEPSNVDTLDTPSVPERSPSPANKLRQTFTLSRKKSGGDISVKSGGAGSGGLGGLFKSSSKGNSLSSTPAETSQVDLQETPAAPVEDTASPQRRNDWAETPKQRGRQLVDTKSPATPPNLLRTPTTVVTPPTPTDPNVNASVFSSRTTSLLKDSPAARSLNSVESIRHRRAQSANLPSKLSTSLTATLPPTAEETKTPGGTLTSPTQPSNPAGFFSSVFGAAQKAGTQITSSFTNLPTQQSKPSGNPVGREEDSEEIVAGTDSRPFTAGGDGNRKPLAIATLGQGNLSLSHLGISETQDSSQMAPSADPPQTNGTTQEGDRARKVEQDAAARAVSSAYEKPIAPAVSQANAGRPPSNASNASNERLLLNGDQTPPRSVVDAESSTIKRSGSVRSKLSGRRKHRGSSATTGTSNSIAEALRHTSTGLANPTAHGGGHRMTGFAVASNKRNKDFHQLFRSVPEDDYLIEDYSAALQRDILLHGRLYVSEGHICFSSNILGWVTNLVISFDEVVSVEKKSTAVIFPNAIVISTLHARNTFASFVARDSTYELLIGIWKISHPNLKSSLNGVTLDDATTGDKTEVAEPDASEGETEEGSEDEIYDEDADDDTDSFADGDLAASTVGSEVGDLTLSRKTSTIPFNAAAQTNAPPKVLEAADTAVVGAAVSSEYPGGPNHEPTQCGESSEHYDRPLTDTTIPAPLGKVYSMMFGPESGAFMRKWLVEDQKSRELNYPDDKTGLDNDHTTFTFDYIKPLSGPVGPKQTKCITTNTLKAFDLEKAVSVDCSTVTPDVPSGNVFTTKTRYCLMWGPNNSTRIIASCTIEWTGKSWLRSPIESGAERGQTDYVKQITAALKAAVTTKPPVKGLPRKGKRKGKKEVFDAEEAITQREADIAEEKKASGWGPLEPIRQIIEPITSMVRISPSHAVIFLLNMMLLYNWFSSPRKGSSVNYPRYSSPERIAAYEEIWRREESALWDWLDDRVGVEGAYRSPLGSREQQKMMGAKKAAKGLEDERMSDRQVQDQIRTTEEKLAQLKEAVDRRKKTKKT